MEKQNKFLFSALFGWWYKNLDTPSWMIYKDWLLVSTSPKTLEVYSNELAAKATWNSAKSLEALAKGIDKKGHFALALKATSESAHRYLNLPVQEHSNDYVIQGNFAVKNALTFGNARVCMRLKKVRSKPAPTFGLPHLNLLLNQDRGS